LSGDRRPSVAAESWDADTYNRLDYAARVDAADSIISPVSNDDVAGPVGSYTARILELGRDRRPAIAREPAAADSRNGCDYSSAHPANAVIAVVHNQKIA
jgi:hypothetical protein